MFKLRHATASAIGPIVAKIGMMIPYTIFVLLYTEQPESWIQICTKTTMKSHLNNSTGWAVHENKR